ncbi:MAG: cobalamin biosynthesis protein CobQ [Firmicutes bacterium]|nr:cobalamin biosynthesis protein CobQ [Bacillota bacterium]
MTEKHHGEKPVLRAAWLFPDILYLHGERGNMLAFQRVAGFAGAEVMVERIDFETEDFNPMDYDFIFCPPGELASLAAVIEWLSPYREALAEFIELGRVLAVTGTSQCIFGGKTGREDGSSLEGLGLIDCDFTERKAVYGDDIHVTTTYGGEEMEVFGSQIQMMDVHSREAAFGQVLYGFGNTGRDRCEGSLKKNSIFSNILGPIFVLNPWLTRKIVVQCLQNIGIEIDEFDFDMSLEMKSLATKKEFTASKVTKLTNSK